MSRQPRKRKPHTDNLADIQDFSQKRGQKVKEQRVNIIPRNGAQEEYLLNLCDYSKRVIVAVGPAGTGKAQPLTAKIKIPGGWTTMGDIKKGDIVTTPDGNEATVLGLFPQGKKETYIVELSDGRKTECCGEHLWEVFYTDNWKLPRIMSTIDIIEFQKNHRKKMKIRLPEHERNGDVALPIDPYVLGVLLGDGSLSIYPTIGLTSSDQSIVDKVNLLCGRDGTFVRSKSKYGYSYKSGDETRYAHSKGEFTSGLKTKINELCLFGTKSDTKFVPDVYMHSSKDQKIKLLQGLLDTDGYVSTRNEVVYTTISKQLCDAVVYLVRSIGGSASVKTRFTSYTHKEEKRKGKLSYNVTICYKTKSDLFSLKRKKERTTNNCQYSKNGTLSIKSITPSGVKDCQCILIDSVDHLYITDEFVVTHNTMLATQFAIRELLAGRIEKIIISRPAVTVDEDLGFLPGTMLEKMSPFIRPLIDVFEETYSKQKVIGMIEDGTIEICPFGFLRGRTFKNSIVILDECQSTTPNQLKAALTRIGEGSRMIVTGDLRQADKGMDGLLDFIERIGDKKHSGLSFVEFKHCHIERDPMVSTILGIYGDKD